MIDPKELRIGNYIFDKDWDAVRPIGATDIYNVAIKGSDNYEPIELTPEWLEKCGFKTPDGYKDTVLYNEIMIDLHLGEYKLRDKPKSQLKYLHQLQNIYYFLSGKELEIKNDN